MTIKRLIGSAPSQVSRNKDLGTMAFQSSDAVRVGQLIATGKSTDVSNTVLGQSANDAITTGGSNTAIGHRALTLNTIGSNNTAIGQGAMASSVSTYYNTAVGDNCLPNLTVGNGMCAFGHAALEACTSGQYNTAYGSSSMRSATTGQYNTGMGYGSLRFLTTGSYNTTIGINSGNAITTGSKNTVVGSFNGNQGGVDIRTTSNNVVLSDGDGTVVYRTNSGRYHYEIPIYSGNAGSNFVNGCAANTWLSLDPVNLQQDGGANVAVYYIMLGWFNGNTGLGYSINVTGQVTPTSVNVAYTSNTTYSGGTDQTGATGYDIPVTWGSHTSTNTLIIRMRLISTGTVLIPQIYTNAPPHSTNGSISYRVVARHSTS